MPLGYTPAYPLNIEAAPDDVTHLSVSAGSALCLLRRKHRSCPSLERSISVFPPPVEQGCSSQLCAAMSRWARGRPGNCCHVAQRLPLCSPAAPVHLLHSLVLWKHTGEGNLPVVSRVTLVLRFGQCYLQRIAVHACYRLIIS